MPIMKQGKETYRFQCMIKGQRFSKTYKSYDETFAEVKKKYMEWKVSCDKDLYVNNTYTFLEFSEIWLKEYCKEYSPIVLKNYRCNLKNWILPRLGKFKLNDITPLVLDGFINHLKSSKNMINGQVISNGTIQKIWQITHAIISTAYMKNLMSANPCLKVRLELKRTIKKNDVHFWDIQTYKKAISLLEAETLDNAKVIEFAAKTGLRRSEIWGLTWKDVNFETGELSVNKTLQKVGTTMQILPCKSVSSVRTISIPQSLVPMLIRYKKNHPNNFYIFQNLDYDAVTKWFRAWQPRVGLDKIRFHDLRHTHATLLLYQGIDIKTISERLGHSNIGITMNIYTHVVRELDTNAAKAIDEIA